MATAYVLGTFDDPLEALTDFQDHAILVLLTGAEQDPDAILDRDTECGINDEVPIFFPPQITAKAWVEAEATALLHVHCANPLDCPELDRVPIRSHGCNPPPNCIAEPDALVAAVARPTCAIPTFLPPSSPNVRQQRNLDFGYAVATAVAYDMSFEDAGGLVNYIEVPFFQENWHDSTTGAPPAWIRTVSRFKGLVRLWESGTVEFVGEVTTTDPTTARDYLVATGTVGGSKTYRVVGTAPVSAVYPAFGAWQAVNFSYRLAAGEVLCLVASVGVGAGTINEDVLAYPVGWKLPFTHNAAASGGAFNNGTISRVGNDLVNTVSFYGAGIFSAQGAVFSYTMDVSTFGKANSVFCASGDQNNPSWLNSPFSRAIPDSPTNGVIYENEVAVGTGSSVTSAKAQYGPIFRSAYSTPTIQQGVDPIP